MTLTVQSKPDHLKSRGSSPAHKETSKFIYKALTLHGKDFLVKSDQSRSHKSAIYFQKCFADKNMLQLLSHS